MNQEWTISMSDKRELDRLIELCRFYDKSISFDHLHSINECIEEMKQVLIALRQSIQNKQMQIFIRNFTGRDLTFDVKYCDTIIHLMELIEEKDGIPIEQQRLLFAGQQLEHDRILYEYGVKHHSIINLVGRLKGD